MHVCSIPCTPTVGVYYVLPPHIIHPRYGWYVGTYPVYGESGGLTVCIHLVNTMHTPCVSMYTPVGSMCTIHREDKVGIQCIPHHHPPVGVHAPTTVCILPVLRSMHPTDLSISRHVTGCLHICAHPRASLDIPTPRGCMLRTTYTTCTPL